MKAVIWKGLYDLEYCQVPEPECKAGWVKIKVQAVGLCATEVHIISGKFEAAEPPHILGHEICGDIVEVGAGCDASNIGRRVVVETYVGCGECEFCRTGRKHLCAAGEIGYPPYAGGDAQYVVVPEGCVRFLKDNISYDEGAILEAVACPFGAVVNARLAPGQTVLVLGAGVAGLSFIQSALALGAKQVLCGVRNDAKAALVRKFGGTVVDLRTQELHQAVMAATGGMGVDLAIDAAGAPATVAQCFQNVKSGGQVMLYGIPAKDAVVELPVVDCILRQITVCGYTGNEKAWDQLISLVSEGKISLKEMVTKTLPLSKFREAVELVENGGSGVIKVVLHPWEDEYDPV